MNYMSKELSAPPLIFMEVLLAGNKFSTAPEVVMTMHVTMLFLFVQIYKQLYKRKL